MENAVRWRQSATGRWRVVESAAHHRARRQRRIDCVVVQVAAAATRLARHHGSTVPAVLEPFVKAYTGKNGTHHVSAEANGSVVPEPNEIPLHGEVDLLASVCVEMCVFPLMTPDP